MKRLGTTVQVLWVILGLLSPAAAGEVYTWTDADGNIHITDKPPKEGAPVDSVIRYANPTEAAATPDPAPQPDSVEMQQAQQLNKQLKRLKERKTQLEKIIAENQASIAAAEKDAAHYRKRSGSYARRNEKTIERQLVVLTNNMTTYQSDLRYVEEDIAETEQLLENIELNTKRPSGDSAATTPGIR
jgi:predicted RNase H-like nuclease (RuvC/YqgF family)